MMSDSSCRFPLALIRRLLRRLAPWIVADTREAARQYDVRRTQDLLSYTQSLGDGVQVGQRLRITDPRCVVLGHRVRLGDDVLIISEGGVTIADDAVIGPRVVIDTVDRTGGRGVQGEWREEIPRPVHIGRGVRIGPAAVIRAGTRIGERALIASGATVHGDIPAGARVGSNAGGSAEPKSDSPARALTVTPSVFPADRVHGDDPRARLFFVVSTGRSGTQAIARVLSQHPQVTCLHEPRPTLIRVSTELAHGLRSEADVEQELRAILCEASLFPVDRWWGESDQKYWNLVPILARLLPSARFLWLLRDGRDVVASTFGQAWFPTAEDRGDPLAPDLFPRWRYYRLHGAACGAVSPQEWERMTLFERHCWHWVEINHRIERHLQALPPERWCQVRLEALVQETDRLFRFLGLPPFPVRVEASNRATYRIRRWREWTAEERTAFERWCGAAMDRWYPGWREEWNKGDGSSAHG